MLRPVSSNGENPCPMPPLMDLEYRLHQVIQPQRLEESCNTPAGFCRLPAQDSEYRGIKPEIVPAEVITDKEVILKSATN